MEDEHKTKKEALIDLQSHLQDIAEKKLPQTLQASIRAKINKFLAIHILSL